MYRLFLSIYHTNSLDFKLFHEIKILLKNYVFLIIWEKLLEIMLILLTNNLLR